MSERFSDFEPGHRLGFELEGCDLVVRQNGYVLWAYGRSPDLADLIGWVLRVTVEDGRLLFLGFNPDLVFEERPYVRFFACERVAPAFHGIADASWKVDLVVMDDEGRINDNYVFTFLSRSVLLGLSGRAPSRVGGDARVAGRA